MALSRGTGCPDFVTPAVLVAAAEHFCAAHPQEGVGFITAAGFIPLENIAEDPERDFLVQPEAWVEHYPVLAVLHSHPKGSPLPSFADQLHQRSSGVPWGIVVTDGKNVGDVVWFGDQIAIPPLFGRIFAHGITDCYSLIRDCFRLGKDKLAALDDPHQRIYHWPFDPVVLYDEPREDGWWNREGATSMYAGFSKAGFEKIDVDPHRPVLNVGDCFLYRLGKSQAVNHAGVYVGAGLILHHVHNYTSHRAPLNLWARGVQCWVRYRGAP